MNQEYDARLVLQGGYVLGQGLRLSGKIYDDKLTSGKHPFPDGTVVSTSPVQMIDGRIFHTRSGTRYLIEFED